MPDTDQWTVEDFAAYADRELETGYSQQQVSAMLVHKGWEQADADAFVGEVDSHRKAAIGRHRRGAFVRLGIGATSTLFGVVASWYSYTTAQAGETYILYFGAIAFGVFYLLSGLSKLDR